MRLLRAAEPAEDPARPASAGRPAYDEDRAAFYDKPQGPQQPPQGEPPRERSEAQRQQRPPGAGRRYGPLDDGVSGGAYGYGKTVDTAFRYLASEGSFLFGVVRPPCSTDRLCTDALMRFLRGAAGDCARGRVCALHRATAVHAGLRPQRGARLAARLAALNALAWQHFRVVNREY